MSHPISETVIAITYRYPMDSLFDDTEGVDVARSAEAYTAALEDAFAAAFPGATIDVGAIEFGTTRIAVLTDAPDSVSESDDAVAEVAHEAVREIGQATWERFGWVVYVAPEQEREQAQEATSAMTTAERIIDALNDYEREHTDEDHNPWQDVIYSLAGNEIDDEATDAADPSHRSSVAVFRDGSAVVWLEDARRWVAREQYT